MYSIFANVFLVILGVIGYSLLNEERQEFTFVQLCDTQFGMGGYDHDIRAFKQAVEEINRLQPDFVVICGGLVHDASDSSFSEFKRIQNDLDMPCYPAPGNHDVGNEPSKYSLEYYRNTIGDDYYTFEKKGYAFIVANTQLWKVDLDWESEKHHKWFKKTLNHCGGNNIPVFVIGHYPLFESEPDEEEGYYNIPIEIRVELLQLFSANGVLAYLSGHKHKTVGNSYDNILLVSGETTSVNFDKRPLGFRLWQVSPSGISHQFVPLETRNQD